LRLGLILSFRLAEKLKSKIWSKFFKSQNHL
jgi:hypothetical protein